MESHEKTESIKDKKINSRTPSLSPTPSSSTCDTKIAKILEACQWKDVDRLRDLATSEGGLVSDSVRCQAWPILLGCASTGDDRKVKNGEAAIWKALPPHPDEDQVQLDVDRSFIYYPHDQSSVELSRRKAELSDLIVEVLRRQPYLSYFQGYHDICQVFLLVLSSSGAVEPVARLSALRIRDFMLPTFAQALRQLQLIPSILYTVSPKLWDHLSGTQPFFALSGTLTMYAHDIQSYGDIARLFDVLLSREAVFSVYMFAAIVLSRSDELFETPSDEPEMLHSILSKLPKPLDIEKLISSTVTLFNQHPPESLQIWRSISSNSVLKTTRHFTLVQKQSLEDGKLYFEKQVKEIEFADRQEKIVKILWKYEKPVRTIGLAVLVGVLAYWLRRSSGPSGFWGMLWRTWSGYRGH